MAPGRKSDAAQTMKLKGLKLNFAKGMLRFANVELNERVTVQQSKYFDELNDIHVCFNNETKRNEPVPHLVHRLDYLFDNFRRAALKKTANKVKNDAAHNKWKSASARKPFELLKAMIGQYQSRWQPHIVTTLNSTSRLSNVRLTKLKVSPIRDMDHLFPASHVQLHHDDEPPLSPLSASLQPKFPAVYAAQTPAPLSETPAPLSASLQPKFPAAYAVESLQTPVLKEAIDNTGSIYCDAAMLDNLLLAHSQHRLQNPACISSSLKTGVIGRILGHQRLIGECTNCRESLVISATKNVKVCLPHGKIVSASPVIIASMYSSMLSGDTSASTQRTMASLGLGTIQPQSSSRIVANILGPIVLELAKEEIKANVGKAKVAAKLRGDVRTIDGVEFALIAGDLYTGAHMI